MWFNSMIREEPYPGLNCAGQIGRPILLRTSVKDAQEHPDKHRQLVVRIWGWSAYFVELDKEYQDHVLSRQQYTV